MRPTPDPAADPGVARRSGRRGAPSSVSVVIPTLNGARHLGTQLRALAGQDFAGPFEVVIADNGSTDATGAIAAAWKGRLDVRVVDAGAKRSIGYATNAGVRAATGELIACTDQDDVVTRGWLTALVRSARDGDLVGGPNALDLLNTPRTRRTRPKTKGPQPHRFGGFLPALSTNSFAIWRDVYDVLGGFRDDYGPGSDVELCWRAQIAGFSLGYSTDAVVEYRLRTTIREIVHQRFEYGRANTQLFNDFHHLGMPRQVWLGVGSWILVGLRTPSVLLPGWRERWFGDLALRLGRMRGSVTYRCIYL